MTLDMAARVEVMPYAMRGCPCHDPDGSHTVRVRRVPLYGLTTRAWVDVRTGERVPCAPLETEGR